MTDTETTTGSFTTPTVEMYYRVETRGERLRRLSNALADGVEVRMILGMHEEQFIEWAEAADELAALADFIEPPTTFEVTATFPETHGGNLRAVDPGWIFNNSGEYGTSNG